MTIQVELRIEQVLGSMPYADVVELLRAGHLEVDMMIGESLGGYAPGKYSTALAVVRNMSEAEEADWSDGNGVN